MSTEVMSWEDRLREEARAASAQFTPSISRISLKAGVMAYGGNPVQGNTMDVIILASAFENSLYTKAYDPNLLSNPDCFSLSLERKNMVPHENVKTPASKDCESCSMAQWGSDPKGGKGKACKEHVKLIILPVGNAGDPEAILASEIAMLKLPVTSGKNWANYVQGLANIYNRPAWSVITKVSATPDMKTQFKINFTLAGNVENGGLLDALSKRIKGAEVALLTPYDYTKENAPQPAPTGKAKKF